MEGLKQCFSNQTQRSNHIIEKMFYMVEINENNFKESRILFGEKANIYNNNFLDVDSLKNQIYNKKFDNDYNKKLKKYSWFTKRNIIIKR